MWVESLTRRETVILARLAEGKTNREIAAIETLSLSTVKWYVNQILGKLGATQRAEAVVRAREIGLLSASSAPPALKHNLPRPLSSFIGREQTIAQVAELVSNYALVTLTGTGGTGKTRLALKVGEQFVAQARELFPDGVWLVQLAPLADPQLVPQVAASVLGLGEAAGCSPTDQLVDCLAKGRRLLILDNCEHLVGAAADLAGALLQNCAGLRILATSREKLGVDGETTFRCPSLSLPDAQPLPSIAELMQVEAVRLFVERAQLAMPGFTLSAENAAAVAHICLGLDGIPLAIELAAARVALLSPEQIQSRLNDRFRLLTSGNRTALPRHQTLRASIDWSYNLLSENERLLLQRLTVFAGGWSLPAAEQVCSDLSIEKSSAAAEQVCSDLSTENPSAAAAAEQVCSDLSIEKPSAAAAAEQVCSDLSTEKPSAATAAVLDGLASLVNKSMITVDLLARGGARYEMLTTVRQYAQEKMGVGQLAQLRTRHLAYYLEFVERIEPELRGRMQVERLEQLEGELDNLRQALDWGLRTDLEAELRMAAALLWFCNLRARLREGLEWLEQGLARVDGSPLSPLVRARALAATGAHHTMRAEKDAAEKLFVESLQLFRELGPPGKAGAASTLLWLGEAEGHGGSAQRALALSRQALDLARESQDPALISDCLCRISAALWRLETGSEEARQLLKEGLQIKLAIGEPDGIALAFYYLGNFASADFDFEQARGWYEKCLPIFRLVGDQDMACDIYLQLGRLASVEGDWARATGYYRKVIEIQGETLSIPAHNFSAYLGLAEIGLMVGEHALAREALDEALDWAEKRAANTMGVARISLGVLAWEAGDRAQARAEFELAFSLLADVPDAHHTQRYDSLARILLGRLVGANGAGSEAESLLKEGLPFFARSKNRAEVGLAVDGLACLAARAQPERAACLFAAAEQLNPLLVNQLYPSVRAARAAALAALRLALGEARCTALWAEGSKLGLEAAVELAMATA